MSYTAGKLLIFSLVRGTQMCLCVLTPGVPADWLINLHVGYAHFCKLKWYGWLDDGTLMLFFGYPVSTASGASKIPLLSKLLNFANIGHGFRHRKGRMSHGLVYKILFHVMGLFESGYFSRSEPLCFWSSSITTILQSPLALLVKMIFLLDLFLVRVDVSDECWLSNILVIGLDQKYCGFSIKI